MDDENEPDDATPQIGPADWPYWTPFEYFEDSHNAGEPRALMEALLKCSLLKQPMPDWVAEAYQEAYKKVTTYEVRSWDDAFGQPHAKGTDLKANRKKLILSAKIFAATRARIDAGANTDLELFAAIGEEFNETYSYVRDVYYEHLNSTENDERAFITNRRVDIFLQVMKKVSSEYEPFSPKNDEG
jgi:hypothetical protein